MLYIWDLFRCSLSERKEAFAAEGELRLLFMSWTISMMRWRKRQKNGIKRMPDGWKKKATSRKERTHLLSAKWFCTEEITLIARRAGNCWNSHEKISRLQFDGNVFSVYLKCCFYNYSIVLLVFFILIQSYSTK